MADKKATATTSKRAALRAQQEAQESAIAMLQIVVSLTSLNMFLHIGHELSCKLS